MYCVRYLPYSLSQKQPHRKYQQVGTYVLVHGTVHTVGGGVRNSGVNRTRREIIAGPYMKKAPTNMMFASGDTMAEWSKAVRSGRILDWRGFKSHWCHSANLFIISSRLCTLRYANTLWLVPLVVVYIIFY